MAAAGLERARGALAGLEAALAVQEEDGDVPARVLAEHLVDTRRKQKLLLTQLRVLHRLLGVIENPGPPPAPPALRSAEARGRWRGLKLGYGEAVEALGGALPPALAQRRRGRRLLRGLRGGLRARQAELQVKVREATGRRDELRRRLEELRDEGGRHRGGLQRQRGRAQRAGAGRRLYGVLAGGEVLPPPSPGTPNVELQVGPPLGPPNSSRHFGSCLPRAAPH